MTGDRNIPICKAFLEKYACGMISPKRVIQIDEKKNDQRPARIESVNKVKRTLMLTFPQSNVVNKRLASSLSSKTWAADSLPDSTSISSFNLLNPKSPNVNPENNAD